MLQDLEAYCRQRRLLFYPKTDMPLPQAILDRAALEILVEYLEGPFRKMNNRWRFHSAGPAACDVEFFISYEFRSRTLGLLMGAMFDAAFRRFSAAFERRADQVYGVGKAC